MLYKLLYEFLHKSLYIQDPLGLGIEVGSATHEGTGPSGDHFGWGATPPKPPLPVGLRPPGQAWAHGPMVPGSHGPMVRWSYGSMVPWCPGPMGPLSHGTIVPRALCAYVVLRISIY